MECVLDPPLNHVTWRCRHDTGSQPRKVASNVNLHDESEHATFINQTQNADSTFQRKIWSNTPEFRRNRPQSVSVRWSRTCHFCILHVPPTTSL